MNSCLNYINAWFGRHIVKQKKKSASSLFYFCFAWSWAGRCCFQCRTCVKTWMKVIVKWYSLQPILSIFWSAEVKTIRDYTVLDGFRNKNSDIVNSVSFRVYGPQDISYQLKDFYFYKDSDGGAALHLLLLIL